MRPFLALPALLMVTAACAGTPADRARSAARQQTVQDELAKRLAGLTPGQPTSCLPITYRGAELQTKGYGPTILYVAGRDLVYRNDTTGGCEGIARGDILVTVQPQGRACHGDIARTVDSTSRFNTGSCALGDFVPYRRAR